MPVASVTVTLTIDQERLLRALLAAVVPEAKVSIKFGPVSEQQQERTRT
jgi:hypothetical protein